MLFYGCFHTDFISYCKAFSQRYSSVVQSMTKTITIKSEMSAGGNFYKACILFSCTSRSCGMYNKITSGRGTDCCKTIVPHDGLINYLYFQWCDGDMSNEINKMINVRLDRMMCVGFISAGM